MLDGFAATGIRGIRVIKESGTQAFFNDIEREAFLAIKRNLELNGIEAEVSNEDFCNLKTGAELCDLDPFGTPEPFIEKGIELSERFLALTATDTAVLFGSNAKKCYERYGVRVRRVDWNKELGARVLCYAVAEKARALGIGIKPIFVYAEDHYLRGYFELCDRGGEISEVEGIGPLWSGELMDTEVLKRALEISRSGECPGKRFIEKLLSRAVVEIDAVGYHDLDSMSSRFRVTEPKPQELVESLKDRGFRASRTIFSPKGIKTDAPIDEIERCFSK
jgi:tRNA (guanine26-N2/guanine27-N2)-dimethyltransferase